MLYLKHSDGDADMTALMGLVAVEMANHVLFAINNAHLLTLGQSYTLIAFLPCGRRFCWRKGDHHPTPYDQIIFFAKTENDAGSFGPFCIFSTRLPSEGVTVLNGESNPIGSDDFCFSLFMIKEYGIHVFCALPLKN